MYCVFCLLILIDLQAPGLNWETVIKNLDHEGFYVLNEAAFAFLMSMYKCACQVCMPHLTFP